MISIKNFVKAVTTDLCDLKNDAINVSSINFDLYVVVNSEKGSSVEVATEKGSAQMHKVCFTIEVEKAIKNNEIE